MLIISPNISTSFFSASFISIGFVIGRNKLYTYKYRCVDFSEIVSITYKDTPYKNNEGDIVLFSSIFINVNSGE
mgnify:CR=1 FL=1